MPDISTIKNFCKLLSAYNVVKIVANYDGYGDSGDMNEITVHVMASPAEINQAVKQTTNPGKITADTRNVRWRDWIASVVKNEDGLITTEKCAEFEQELFDLLPGGWEINEGSYGEIVVDVATEEITVEHSERYTEVRTETHRY